MRVARMTKPRDWVEDAKALLEMGAVMVDAGTVRGLLARIAELEERITDMERESFNNAMEREFAGGDD